MKAEDRVLFAAARQDFREEHRSAVEALAPFDWEKVGAIAESHGVAPIVCSAEEKKMSSVPNIEYMFEMQRPVTAAAKRVVWPMIQLTA